MVVTIEQVRPVLLTAPYGNPETSAENLVYLPHGLRTTGLVEITLSDGNVGVGEGYLAVFAPRVFEAIVNLVAPVLIGKEAGNIGARVRDLVAATGYWSYQGAARHAISAFEIALHDCASRAHGVPLFRYLGAATAPELKLYASGGDSISPESMGEEVEAVSALGIDVFKIRGRAHQLSKVAWSQRAGAARGIGIAVDMTQNLVTPSQRPEDVYGFISAVEEASGAPLAFLEEVLGPDRIDELPAVRRATEVPIAGGEIVTTGDELVSRIERGAYDIAQPDATVLGGIMPTLAVFDSARASGTDVYTHCWGGGIGVLANYHAAIAGGGTTVEWALPSYPIRDAFFEGALTVTGGVVSMTSAPGLGATLTREIEDEFRFREEAVYRCWVDPARVPAESAWE